MVGNGEEEGGRRGAAAAATAKVKTKQQKKKKNRFTKSKGEQQTKRLVDGQSGEE